MSGAPPEARRLAAEIVDTIVEVVLEAKRPILWHELINEFYRPSRGYNKNYPIHERTLFRHAVSAVKQKRIAVHGRPRERIYTAPDVKLSKEAMRVVYLAREGRGRRLGEEDLL